MRNFLDNFFGFVLACGKIKFQLVLEPVSLCIDSKH